MDNKYLYMITAAVMSVLSWFILGLGFFDLGEPGEVIWIYAVVIAVAVGAGSTGGNDFLSIIEQGIKDYIPTMIMLAIFGFVVSIAYGLIMEGGPVNAIFAVKVAATYAVVGVFTNLTVSFLKKAG
jgi:hypothetical protein